jgi:hypothetical protein
MKKLKQDLSKIETMIEKLKTEAGEYQSKMENSSGIKSMSRQRKKKSND